MLSSFYAFIMAIYSNAAYHAILAKT